MKSVSYYRADHQSRHRHHLSLPSTAIVTSARTWRHTRGLAWFHVSCEANWLSCLVYLPGLSGSVSFSFKIVGQPVCFHQIAHFPCTGGRGPAWFRNRSVFVVRPQVYFLFLSPFAILTHTLGCDDEPTTLFKCSREHKRSDDVTSHTFRSIICLVDWGLQLIQQIPGFCFNHYEDND